MRIVRNCCIFPSQNPEVVKFVVGFDWESEWNREKWDLELLGTFFESCLVDLTFLFEFFC